MADIKLNPAQIKLTKELYEAELSRIRAVAPDPVHRLAVDRFRQDLIRVLKKISHGKYYY